MWDGESTYGNSTQVSANNLGVRAQQPAGGLLHAGAMIRASGSPVTLAGTGGVSRFLRRKLRRFGKILFDHPDGPATHPDTTCDVRFGVRHPIIRGVRSKDNCSPLKQGDASGSGFRKHFKFTPLFRR
jgi:hypothetical protein